MDRFDFGQGGTMPALGLGTWKADPASVGDAVREAIRIGYRHFDCAPIYGNQAEIGQALAAAINDGEVQRRDLWITSKLWNSDHARADTLPALERTLSDLRLEYLDLFLIHWPVSLKAGVTFPRSGDDYLTDAQAPLNQTWAGMEQLVTRGSVPQHRRLQLRPQQDREAAGYGDHPPGCQPDRVSSLSWLKTICLTGAGNRTSS